MSEPERYLFEKAGDAPELRRLRALEAVFDHKTRELLRAGGVGAGQRCLEVGAGAGSIAAWLQAQVGPGGHVLAVDGNVRFLGELPGEIEVVKGDIRELSLPERAFDCVHARYVLIHTADSGGVFAALLRCLKPGGSLLLEEPDFGAARACCGPEALGRAFERVRDAILATFEERGMDPRLGAALPALAASRGLELVTLECDSHLERGGSGLAGMMRLSTEQLAEAYLATDRVTAEDLDSYARFASDASCWGIYYATYRVLARRALA